ncbi:lysosomal proton-coupled steroid conjugate and bile acid symporter SLC46A3-like isoform X2 [Amphiura filiformis]|uniref:lysosomal proton-coupled steroid conjugate and bile acid symporter SLC46A3-like isoform X2 n=1 Tax=Amphiura filiformis TaxID=82378 RepID=UPI003B219DD6
MSSNDPEEGTQIFVIYGIGPPFCWSSVTESFFSFAFLIAGTLGLLIGTKLFSLCLANFWILQIAYGFALLNYILAALAPTTAIFILGAVIGGLRAMDLPVLNTILSTTVSPSEQGVAFAVQSSVTCLGNFVSPLILNPIYSATVATQPSLVFYIMASLCIVLIILSWLWKFCTNMRSNEDVEDS